MTCTVQDSRPNSCHRLNNSLLYLERYSTEVGQSFFFFLGTDSTELDRDNNLDKMQRTPIQYNTHLHQIYQLPKEVQKNPYPKKEIRRKGLSIMCTTDFCFIAISDRRQKSLTLPIPTKFMHVLTFISAIHPKYKVMKSLKLNDLQLKALVLWRHFTVMLNSPSKYGKSGLHQWS